MKTRESNFLKRLGLVKDKQDPEHSKINPKETEPRKGERYTVAYQPFISNTTSATSSSLSSRVGATQEESFSNAGEASAISSKDEFDYISSSQTMKLLGISAPTVRKYAKLGCYKAYHFGVKRTYYRRSEILTFLEKGARNE